jgi:hypothetical protein
MNFFFRHYIVYLHLLLLCFTLLCLSQLFAQPEDQTNKKASPNPPVLNSPLDLSTNVALSPSLDVTVSDDDLDNLTVTYYGRVMPGTIAQPDFTLVGLPDTQNYTGVLSGGTNEYFKAQTQWVANHRIANNIAYVSHVGDLVQNGDNGGNPIEWLRADTSMKFLEDSITTLLPQGIPYGIAVGNHEQTPKSDPHGSTTFYNQYFGSGRYFAKNYYGGHYGSNSDNSYQFFSASGLSFIVIYLEYDPAPEPAVLNWADSLLKVYNSRRGIVVSHYLLDGNSFSTQGRIFYDSLKDNPNLFLMLCGHLAEGRRQDTFNGKTVYTLMSDFQGRSHGGDGWLRLMEFSPLSDSIRVKTYSPTLGQYENDSDSKFSLYYNMKDTNFQVIGVNTNVPSGSNSIIKWPVLSPMTNYEWYVTVSDGNTTTTGPKWRFSTLDLPLPIQLSYFRVEPTSSGEGALLSWSTISEINNYGFSIQRSNGNVQTYENIGFVAGKGTTTEPQTYTFLDENVTSNVEYRLEQIDNNGLKNYYGPIMLNPNCANEDEVPAVFKLNQNFPNPFNPTTKISFSLANAGYSTLRVYNIVGQEVATLFSGNAEASRQYVVNFDAKELTSGLYFYKLESGSNVEVKKLTLVK